jgi:hypothetical protein
MTDSDFADDVVLPFLRWQREYSGLSEPTARRITKPGGGGPPLIRLSERRLGVRLGDHRAWVQQRAATHLNKAAQ